MGRSAWTFLICFICFSCTTYYQKNLKFNTYFQNGQIQEAENVLTASKKIKKKEQFLYNVNRGVLASMQGEYENSNSFFETAYLLVEDYQINYLNEGVAFLTNPNMVHYKGEGFEMLLINYYKAFNYLKLGNKEAALIECRRMNIRLNEIGDKYKSANKYKRDAFMHNLMGIIYDANDDHNNAFIAYRNALNIYEEDYINMFNLNPPDQLKRDLLRSAYLNGFQSDLDFFERKFGMNYTHDTTQQGDVVFLWHNGLGPVKSEWSINFSILRGAGGNVAFVNEEMGFNFTFPMASDQYQSSGLSDLEFIRVAFPKFVERKPLITAGMLHVNNKEYKLEKAEDINAIAFKSLQDRMMAELGRTLLRVALKKAAEYKLRSQNQGLGAALSVINAVTEKTDTRHWQTLPHSIHYTRISLPEGEHTISFNGDGNTDSTESFSIPIKAGQTFFQTFHTLGAAPALVK